MFKITENLKKIKDPITITVKLNQIHFKIKGTFYINNIVVFYNWNKDKGASHTHHTDNDREFHSPHLFWQSLYFNR